MCVPIFRNNENIFQGLYVALLHYEYVVVVVVVVVFVVVFILTHRHNTMQSVVSGQAPITLECKYVTPHLWER